MDKKTILSVLEELYKISGFRISLHTTSFEEIAAFPDAKLSFCSYIQTMGLGELDKCKSCDKEACERVLKSGETLVYKCRHGLIEAISPLYNFGILTGFLMMGQVRVEGDGIDQMLLALARIGKHDFEAREICAAIPTVKEDMIRSYVNIMTVCARYLTLSNSITSAKQTVGCLAMQYINEHSTEKIGIKDICNAIGYSKSTVLVAFKKEFGTTVNAYLTNVRLEKSKKMLLDENITINEIALACGFSDQSYYSKVFSVNYGISPTDFRRDNKK